MRNSWIDEYDAPMQAAYQHDYYPRMRDVIRGLLGQCLKDNADPSQSQTFLHRSVITGILRVAKEDIFSDLNNVGVYDASNPFSFMQLQDVQELTNFFERRVAAYQLGVSGNVSLTETF